MTAVTLAGSPVALELSGLLRDEIDAIESERGSAPTLGIVLATADPSALAYSNSIRKTAARVGVNCETHNLEPASTTEQIVDYLRALSSDEATDGIIVLQPLAEHVDRRLVADAISPDKDIDGITTANAGRVYLGDNDALAPSTPAGGILLLKHYEVPIAGQRAVVVGRSPVVGRPMAMLLLAEHATVTVAHSRTRDLASITQAADIVVAAVGSPGAITAEMISPGTVVVDFGVNFVNGSIVGDVAYDEVSNVARAITPVPGGTGRVTTMVLMRNTVRAARLQMRPRAGSTF